MQGIVLLIGSVFDKNEYHKYHLTKESSPFTYAYADIIVIGVIVFTLIFTLYTAFALLTCLLKLVFGSLPLNKTFHQVIDFILVGASLCLAFISIKYTFFLPLPLIYGLLLIKLSLASHPLTMKHFANVTNLVFPLTLSLALHIDTYMVDGWRFHHTPTPFTTNSLHYQDSSLSQAKFAHLTYMLSFMFLSSDLTTVVEAYGQYGRHV